MKINLVLFVALVSVLLSANVLAKPSSTVLPTQFSLSHVLITVSSYSNIQDAENYSISLNGNGESSLSKNIEKRMLNVSNETLVELLNDFYQVHFFEIPDKFQIKKRLVLKENKILTTVLSKESAAERKEVCVKLRTYKKCVSVIDNQPLSVAQIVKKIEALAGM